MTRETLADEHGVQTVYKGSGSNTLVLHQKQDCYRLQTSTSITERPADAHPVGYGDRCSNCWPDQADENQSGNGRGQA